MDTASSFFTILLDMGYAEELATSALRATGGRSIDEALDWLIAQEHRGQCCGINEDYCAMGVASTSDTAGPVVGVPSLGVTQGSMFRVIVHPDGEESQAMAITVNAECRIVLVVPEDLNLTQGKLAANCSQATTALYMEMIINQVPWMSAWESQGRKIIVLKTDLCSQLQDIAERASEKGLLIHNLSLGKEGEIAGQSFSSGAILAIGGIGEIIDDITRHLTVIE